MKTIYIKGIGKFKKKISKGLLKSDLIAGVDYIISSTSDGENFELVWCRDDLTLRQLKLSISAKYIWRCRMKFYTSIEEMNPPKVDDLTLTPSELAFIQRVKNREKITI